MINTKLGKTVMRVEHQIRNYSSQNRAEHEIRNYSSQNRAEHEIRNCSSQNRAELKSGFQFNYSINNKRGFKPDQNSDA